MDLSRFPLLDLNDGKLVVNCFLGLVEASLEGCLSGYNVEGRGRAVDGLPDVDRERVFSLRVTYATRDEKSSPSS